MLWISLALGGVIAFAELALEAHSRGVSLELVGDATAVVRGDATLLRVLLRNLADNAVRHGAPGGRDSRIRGRR